MNLEIFFWLFKKKLLEVNFILKMATSIGLIEVRIVITLLFISEFGLVCGRLLALTVAHPFNAHRV